MNNFKQLLDESWLDPAEDPRTIAFLKKLANDTRAVRDKHQKLFAKIRKKLDKSEADKIYTSLRELGEAVAVASSYTKPGGRLPG